MTFEREGLNELVEAVEDGKVDAVLVKDLSRLGRNRVQTALFIEFLMEKNVRVLSVTENIDTFNEEDDLLIGVKQLTNDLYAKDISKKIRYGYRQKQKEGLVIVPPFGYLKDKNTKKVHIVPEAAETVRHIYEWYLQGMGDKKIIQQLTSMGCKSPARMQLELFGKRHGRSSTKVGQQYMWNERTVKRILLDEQYTGTLINRKTLRSKIVKMNQSVPVEEQFRHEGKLPVIIPKETWQRVQDERKRRDEHNVHGRHGNKLVNRYAGLLRCGECGASFTAQRRKYKGDEYTEYVCSNYHRIGRIACTQHRVKEEALDELLLRELRHVRLLAGRNWDSVQGLIEQYIQNYEINTTVVDELESQLEELREDNRNLTRQIARARDESIIDAFSEQMMENQQQITALTERVETIKDSGQAFENRLKSLETSILMLDEILKNGPISNAALRDIVSAVQVHQVEEKLVDLQYELKAPFQNHVDLYNQFGVMKRINVNDPKEITESLTGILDMIGA